MAVKQDKKNKRQRKLYLTKQHSISWSLNYQAVRQHGETYVRDY